MIGLFALSYDPNGAGMVRLRPESATVMIQGQRRQSKTATLDGGASVYDTGSTVSDMTWTFTAEARKETVGLIEHLSRSYQEIGISTIKGCFLVSIPQWSIDGDDIRFEVSVLERMT